jgi:hypothetical protein
VSSSTGNSLSIPVQFLLLGIICGCYLGPNYFNSACNDGAVSLGRLKAQSFVFISSLCLDLPQKAVTHLGLLQLWKVSGLYVSMHPLSCTRKPRCKQPRRALLS